METVAESTGATRRGVRDTRQEILDVAGELLQQRGFNGFSYQHVAERLGIKTAAVHYHFRAKGDLGIALIERHVEELQGWASTMERSGMDPLQLLEAYFELVRGFLRSGDRICVSGALQAELEAIPETMRAPVREMVERHRIWLERLLARGRDAGLFTFAGSVEDRTVAMMAAIQGALQIGRTCGLEWFEAVLRQLKADLVE